MMKKQKIKLLFALNCFDHAAVCGPPEAPATQKGESSKTLWYVLNWALIYIKHLYILLIWKDVFPL